MKTEREKQLEARLKAVEKKQSEFPKKIAVFVIVLWIMICAIRTLIQAVRQ